MKLVTTEGNELASPYLAPTKEAADQLESIHSAINLMMDRKGALLSFRNDVFPLLLEEAAKEDNCLPVNQPNHGAANMRFGDLYLGNLVSYGDLSIGRKVGLQCGCGQLHTTTLQTLRRWVKAPTDFYYKPLSDCQATEKESLSATKEANLADMRGFFSPSSHHEKYYFTCPHIEETLRTALPQPYDVWRKMRAHVTQAILMSDRMTAPWEWFRKDFGFLQFVEDVGLPSAPNLVLRRYVEKNLYAARQYSWSVPLTKRKVKTKQDPFVRNLSQRYHAARDRASKMERQLHFESFEHFLESIPPLPEDFKKHPGNWRLQYANQEVRGLGPDNAYWLRVSNSKVNVSYDKFDLRDIAANMVDALEVESEEDLLQRVHLLVEELRLLHSDEPYAQKLKQVPVKVLGETLLKEDVMETLWDRVVGHVIQPEEEE